MSNPFLLTCLVGQATCGPGRLLPHLPFPYTHEDRLEVLAGAPSRSAVHMALEAVDEPEPASCENVRIEVAPVVHDDDHGRVRLESSRLGSEDVRHPVDVGLERALARSQRRGAELPV